jgi:hypothetical protein
VIELSDPVVNINLGLNEYKALRALGVNTIRQLLLLDISKITVVHRYSRIIAEGISDWQKLLRRYLTYEKLHAARENSPITGENIHIYNKISETDLDKKDIEILNSVKIDMVLDFLTADLDKLLEGKVGPDKAGQLIGIQNEMLSPPEMLPIPEYPENSEYIAEEPVKVLSLDEFIKEPLSETELGAGEIELLGNHSIKTVEEFMNADLGKVLSGKERKIQLRLVNWQRYLQKNLNQRN